jgi:uncharacterized membrane protein YdbT with pleckstrin-like domain
MSVKDQLLAGESITFSTEKHWFAPLRDSFIPILLLIGAYLVSLISPNPDGILSFVGTLFDWLRLGMLIVGIVWIVYNIVVWRTAVFAVTNRRVIREEGLISRRSSATILSTVTDVQSRVPMLGGPLGFGDLEILTQSGAAGADRFQTIKHPTEFRDHMLNTKIAMETPAATPAVPAPDPVLAAPVAPSAAPAPTTDDQLQTLARLAELRDSGAITPEEYEAKKTEVLSRI